jgi:hypothetical protein
VPYVLRASGKVCAGRAPSSAFFGGAVSPRIGTGNKYSRRFPFTRPQKRPILLTVWQTASGTYKPRVNLGAFAFGQATKGYYLC